jgi:DDE superfamily endonuclease
MSLFPDSLLLLQPFVEVFTRPTFSHLRTLVYGALLASGRRTVTAALRAMGRGDERHFTTFHRVLNRAARSPLHLSRILLELLVMTFLAPDVPLILLIDGTLERRWGRRIAYKGRFHDAVRSQTGHVVTSEGIHWLCLMLLVSVPWCRRHVNGP